MRGGRGSWGVAGSSGSSFSTAFGSVFVEMQTLRLGGENTDICGSFPLFFPEFVRVETVNDAHGAWLTGPLAQTAYAAKGEAAALSPFRFLYDASAAYFILEKKLPFPGTFFLCNFPDN